MGIDNGFVWFLAIGILAIGFAVWAVIGMSHHPVSDGYGIPATQGTTP